jgi:hypothetical protein
MEGKAPWESGIIELRKSESSLRALPSRFILGEYKRWSKLLSSLLLSGQTDESMMDILVTTASFGYVWTNWEEIVCYKVIRAHRTEHLIRRGRYHSDCTSVFSTLGSWSDKLANILEYWPSELQCKHNLVFSLGHQVKYEGEPHWSRSTSIWLEVLHP